MTAAAEATGLSNSVYHSACPGALRLKQNLHLLPPLLESVDGLRFTFFVVSAAPEEVIRSALEGIVPECQIFGTRFRYDPLTGDSLTIRGSAATPGTGVAEPPS